MEEKDLRESIKQRFREKRGYWSDGIWSSMLHLDPHFLNSYLTFSSVPFEQKKLSLKDKELMYIAFDVCATHMYGPGTEAHMKNALAYGATTGELLEVIEIASLIGMKTLQVGVPLLHEALLERGDTSPSTWTSKHDELKQLFIETHGYWDDRMQAPLLYCPALFDAYIELSSVPYKHDALSPKMRHLVSLAIDAASTHLQVEGMKLHIRRALDEGATKEEILEVFELISTVGIHAATFSVPILEKVVESKATSS